jgi:hypothetical protein
VFIVDIIDSFIEPQGFITVKCFLVGTASETGMGKENCVGKKVV